MARTVCPFSLNAVVLIANAGRRFVSALSVKGNGTTTTSHGSEITKRLFVLGGGPFVEGVGEGGVEGGVKGLDMLHCNDTVMNIVGDRVAGFQTDGFTNFLWNGYLTFNGKLARKHRKTSFTLYGKDTGNSLYCQNNISRRLASNMRREGIKSPLLGLVESGCSENGISTNLFKVLSKYPIKMFQLIEPEDLPSAIAEALKRQKEKGKGKKEGQAVGGRGEESLMPGLVERAVEEMIEGRK